MKRGTTTVRGLASQSSSRTCSRTRASGTAPHVVFSVRALTSVGWRAQLGMALTGMTGASVHSILILFGTDSCRVDGSGLGGEQANQRMNPTSLGVTGSAKGAAASRQPAHPAPALTLAGYTRSVG